MQTPDKQRVALIEAGSPGLNIYSHVAMGRGVPLLATVLHDAGHEVRAFVEDISGKGTVDWDFVRGADVVGLSAITCTMTRTADLLAEARRVNPEAVIVLGGPEPTCAPERALDAGADYVIRGEAESSLLAFLDNGDVALRDSKHPDGPILRYTAFEWEWSHSAVPKTSSMPKSCSARSWCLLPCPPLC